MGKNRFLVWSAALNEQGEHIGREKIKEPTTSRLAVRQKDDQTGSLKLKLNLITIS